MSSGGDIGYYTYLSFLNSYIRKKNAELTPLLISQNSLKAKQVVAKEGVSAATDELEAAMSNFEDIASVPYPVFTGVTKIEDLSMSIECEIEAEFGYDIWITMPENTVQMNTSYSPFSVAAPVYQNDIISITPSNPNYATPIWSIGSGSSSSAFNLNFNAYGFASSSLGGKARSGSSTNWYSF